MRYIQSTASGYILAGGLALLLSGCLTSGVDTVPNDTTSIAGNTNSAPVISGSPPSAITIGQTYTFIPNASDPDGDPLTFSIVSRPTWANFDTVTGELSGPTFLGNEGDYADIVISVTDGRTSTSLRQFSISVTQASLGSATLSLIAPTFNTDGTPFTDLAAFKIYYGMTVDRYPNDVYIGNPGISTYVVENLAPGTYYFVATAINRSDIESVYSNEVTRVVE